MERVNVTHDHVLLRLDVSTLRITFRHSNRRRKSACSVLVGIIIRYLLRALTHDTYKY